MEVCCGGPSAAAGTVNSRRSRSHAASRLTASRRKATSAVAIHHRLFREGEDIQHSAGSGLLLELGRHVSETFRGRGIAWIEIARDDATDPPADSRQDRDVLTTVRAQPRGG